VLLKSPQSGFSEGSEGSEGLEKGYYSGPPGESRAPPDEAYLLKILEEGWIRSVYHGIHSLENAHILGYEALA